MESERSVVEGRERQHGERGAGRAPVGKAKATEK